MSESQLAAPPEKRVTVVVPTCDEEPNLHELYDRLARMADGLPAYEFDFLFVDDGSTDATPRILAELHREDPRVKALRFARNFGSQAACLAGLTYASGEIIAIIAADLQDPPELLPEMLARIEAGCDVVIAYREQREDPWLKVKMANLFHRMIRRIAIPNWPVQGADVAMMRRPVADVLARWRQKNTALFAQVVWTGFRQEFIPYTKQARHAGHTKFNMAKKVKVAVDSFASFSFAPIRFISYLGILLSGVGLVWAGVVLYSKLVLGSTDAGWASVMVAILLLGGMQLLVLGVLGEYLWRVADEVRGAPPFVVQSMLGVEGENRGGSSGGSAWREDG